MAEKDCFLERLISAKLSQIVIVTPRRRHALLWEEASY